MFSDAALLIATVAMVPLTLLIAYMDMRDLRIPNWSILAVFGVFLATASWGLPFDVFLWRLGYGAAAFAAGLLIYSITSGKVGAGDLKLLAALAPFLYAGNILGFALIYVTASVFGLTAYLVARRIANGRATGFKGIDTRGYYPAGVLLGLTMAATLVVNLTARFT